MRDSLAFYPYVIVRIRCHSCERQGSYRLARLAAKFGPEIPMDEVMDRITVDCPWQEERRSRSQRGCKAFFPDLTGPPLPPDLPPGLAPLRVIKGGKQDNGEPREQINKRKAVK